MWGSDYENFNSKNAYLAAKLLSIFLENPVIFIGYSITDTNITDLLGLIADMMESQEQLERLAKNLIFVTRPDDEKDQLESVLMTVGSKKLYFTHIRTHDYSKIYKALQHSERKIPVHLLRALKEQIYNIVKTTEDADRRIAVKDFDEATAHLPFSDSDILTQVLPELSKQNRTYLPVQKYGKVNPTYQTETNIQSTLRELLGFDIEHYKKKIPTSVIRQFDKAWTFEEIIGLEKVGESECSLNKRIDFLALWLINNPTQQNCDLLKQSYLSTEFDNLKSKGDASTFRRLICILDQIENKIL